MLRGVVHLARELGLEIVVEGVETDDQLVMIRENDCADLIQGFIFGTPMPKGAFIELATKLSKQQAAARDMLHLTNSAKSLR